MKWFHKKSFFFTIDGFPKEGGNPYGQLDRKKTVFFYDRPKLPVEKV